MVRLVPRETTFFELFGSMSTNLTQAAQLLQNILASMENVEVQVQQLDDIEQAGDDITHSILIRLNQTFITPFDREDVHRLATSVDDVLDLIHAAGERLIIYKINVAPPSSCELAEVILRQCEALAQAISLFAKHDQVLERCAEVSQLENQADRIFREAVVRLFEREKDPITLIKLKELYELLESASDKAEDAANVLETVALKMV